jgi:hypothetical protein
MKQNFPTMHNRGISIRVFLTSAERSGLAWLSQNFVHRLGFAMNPESECLVTQLSDIGELPGMMQCCWRLRLERVFKHCHPRGACC